MAKLKKDTLSMFADPSTLSFLEDDDASDIASASLRNSGLLSKYPVRFVLIADIIEDSDVQFREKPFDPEHNEKDASLLATMGDPNIGLLQPIMVQEIAGLGNHIGPFGQGKKYKMVFGHNRRDSAKMLGWEKISAHIAKSDEDVSHFTFVENNSSKPQSPYERAITLRKYYDLHPSLTLAELAEKVGLPLGNAGKYLQITEKDTPEALLALFARGLAVNAAVTLKSVFLATTPSDHIRLAELLDGVSERSAKLLSTAVIEENMDPFEAVEVIGITPKNIPVFETVSNELIKIENIPLDQIAVVSDTGELPKNCFGSKPNTGFRTKSSTSSQSTSIETINRLSVGIRPENDEVVTKLAVDNGTSKVLVRKLINKALTLGLSLNELNDACLISSHCDDPDMAVVHLTTIMADKRAFSAFKQYANSIRLVLRVMTSREKNNSLKVITALRDSIFTPLPLMLELPRKKIRKQK